MSAKSTTLQTSNKPDFNEVMTRKEALNPELARCIVSGGPFGPMLKHSLVHDIMYTSQLNGLYNEQLKERRKYVDEKIEKGDWSGALWMHERPWRFQLFIDYMDKLNNKEYWELLGEIWSDTENLWQYKDSVPFLLTARPNPRQMMNENARKLFKTLPREIVVYRGYQSRNKRGFAWSLSPAKALWFARRFEQPRHNVVRGVIQKNDVFAVLTGRNEFEIIALPEYVKRQQIVKPLERPEHLNLLFKKTSAVFKLPHRRSQHGPEHWERVERNAIALCEANKKADMEVCRIFAICHDCQRDNESDDPDHGHRAAHWINQNLDLIPLNSYQRETLLEACRYHNDGQVSKDPTIGTCWDADRLDLPRVGITPNPDLLSTKAGRGLMWCI